jgi:hypothetical protein
VKTRQSTIGSDSHLLPIFFKLSKPPRTANPLALERCSPLADLAFDCPDDLVRGWPIGEQASADQIRSGEIFCQAILCGKVNKTVPKIVP